MEAIELARLHALTSAERHDYLPATVSEAAAFVPHAWVVEAIARAAGKPTTPPPATTQASSSPPRIGELWAGQGGFYAGIVRGEDGTPDCHLILATQHGETLTWAAAKKWAAGVEADGHNDFALPTRNESALLYANVRDLIDATKWYWTGSQYSASSAWLQSFYYGGQYDDDKKAGGWARAVRRLTA